MEIDKDLDCCYKNGNREKAHEINQAREIQVKKDEYEAFKDCERLTKIETKTDKQTRVKDKDKAFPCYKKTTVMDSIDETIECSYINRIGTEQDEEPNTTNNLEHACEVWKKKVEKLKIT
ncbi:hypothetical protein F8M41_019324 [Gigaspora margarita]|uniref:Uncharacterized protein n=1 Tax=Gigaspora margarita TaxID=4874 RepID=A0A8H4AK68_GIGMA|nr:hypothetical protein F8M41_019324 [Gigaspora margarita]